MIDPFVHPTLGRPRHLLPGGRSVVPLTYPAPNSQPDHTDFSTPQAHYKVNREWKNKEVMPRFNIGTRVSVASFRRAKGGNGSSSISSPPGGGIAMPNARMNQGDHAVSPLMPARLIGSRTSSPMAVPSSSSESMMSMNASFAPSSSLPSSRRLTPVTSRSSEAVLSLNDDEELTLVATTSSSASSFASIFHPGSRIRTRSSQSDQRPRNNVSKMKSSLFDSVYTHDRLATLLAQRASATDDPIVFYNVGMRLVCVDVQSKECLGKVTFARSYPTCHDINRTTLSHEHLDVLIGLSTGDVVWYDPLCNRYTRYNKRSILHKGSITKVAWVPGSMDMFLVAFDDGVMLLLDRDREDQVYTPNEPTTVEDHCFMVSKPKVSRFNPVSHWRMNNHGIPDFAFSSDGTRIAIAGADSSLRLVDFTGERLRHLFLAYFGKLLCVAWSPDDRYIVTGGQDDLVSIWSVQEKRMVARGQGHHSWVTSVTFDSHHCDGTTYRFASVGEDGRFILWDYSPQTLHKPAKHRHQVISKNQIIDSSLHGPHPHQVRDDDDDDENGLMMPRLHDWSAIVIHPSLGKTQVPFVPPLVSRTIHSDPCTSIAMDQDTFITSDRHGCVRTWSMQ